MAPRIGEDGGNACPLQELVGYGGFRIEPESGTERAGASCRVGHSGHLVRLPPTVGKSRILRDQGTDWAHGLLALEQRLHAGERHGGLSHVLAVLVKRYCPRYCPLYVDIFFEESILQLDRIFK